VGFEKVRAERFGRVRPATGGSATAADYASLQFGSARGGRRYAPDLPAIRTSDLRQDNMKASSEKGAGLFLV